jgi:hypothetical protein
LRENYGNMADPIFTIIFGAGLLLFGLLMKRTKNPNGNAFIFTGLAIVVFTVFISVLIRLF